MSGGIGEDHAEEVLDDNGPPNVSVSNNNSDLTENINMNMNIREEEDKNDLDGDIDRGESKDKEDGKVEEKYDDDHDDPPNLSHPISSISNTTKGETTDAETDVDHIDPDEDVESKREEDTDNTEEKKAFTNLEEEDGALKTTKESSEKKNKLSKKETAKKKKEKTTPNSSNQDEKRSVKKGKPSKASNLKEGKPEAEQAARERDISSTKPTGKPSKEKDKEGEKSSTKRKEEKAESKVKGERKVSGSVSVSGEDEKKKGTGKGKGIVKGKKEDDGEEEKETTVDELEDGVGMNDEDVNPEEVIVDEHEVKAAALAMSAALGSGGLASQPSSASSTLVSTSAAGTAAAPSLPVGSMPKFLGDYFEKTLFGEHIDSSALFQARPPLHQLTLENDIHGVKKHLHSVQMEERVDYVNRYDIDGNTALMFALTNDQMDVFLLLLDYGADVNIANNKRNSLLHLACALNRRKHIKSLIEHGATLQAENGEYNQPHQMVKGGDEKVANMLNYINSCFDEWQEKLKEKKSFIVSRIQRAYLRGVFDICDLRLLGYLRFEELNPLLSTMVGNEVKGSDSNIAFQWFKIWDKNKDGVISFQEFLYGILAFLTERERQRRKARRRALAKARRKKKKEEQMRNRSSLYARALTSSRKKK